MPGDAPLLDWPDEEPQPPEARRSLEAQLADQVCAWIELHLHEDIGWERLIRVSGVPAQRLQQIFQRHRKTTPMMYIRARRLAQEQPAQPGDMEPPKAGS